MPRLALVREAWPALPGGARATPAVLVVDDRRRIVEANGDSCALLGLEREAIVGRKLDALIAPAMRERLDHVWRAFLGVGGHAGPFELATAGAVAEIQIALTDNLMPGRHLLVLAPMDSDVRAAVERAGELAASDHEPAAYKARAAATRPPSARELEVVRLLATGATDPQIAELLELSPATVQTHVRNAKSKLGARTRAHAVALAVGGGMISLD